MLTSAGRLYVPSAGVTGSVVGASGPAASTVTPGTAVPLPVRTVPLSDAAPGTWALPCLVVKVSGVKVLLVISTNVPVFESRTYSIVPSGTLAPTMKRIENRTVLAGTLMGVLLPEFHMKD